MGWSSTNWLGPIKYKTKTKRYSQLFFRRYIVTNYDCAIIKSRDAWQQIGRGNTRKILHWFTLHPKDFKIHEHFVPSRYEQDGNNIALVRLQENAITCNENPSSAIFPIPLDWNLGIAFCLKHFTTYFQLS